MKYSEKIETLFQEKGFLNHPEDGSIDNLPNGKVNLTLEKEPVGEFATIHEAIDFAHENRFFHSSEWN